MGQRITDQDRARASQDSAVKRGVLDRELARSAVSGRWVERGAQGVIKWHRKLGGRRFWFVLTYAGWWGVGATGRLTVHAERPGLEGYPEYRYLVREVMIRDVEGARAALEAKLALQGRYFAHLREQGYF